MDFAKHYTELALSVWEQGRRERERTGSEWPKEAIMFGALPVAVLADNQEELDRINRFNRLAEGVFFGGLLVALATLAMAAISLLL